MLENITDFFYLPAVKVAAAVLAVLLLAAAAGLVSHKKQHIGTRALTYSAICIAVATVLSLIKPFEMPFGGSITFCSMFFITIIGYWFGPVTALASGMAYGLLQLAIDPYVVHPAQLLLDYILGFGALGVSGFFYGKRHGLFTGYVAGCFCRFLMSALSGLIFFAEYAPEGQPLLLYTVVYNASYILPEMALTLVIILIPAVRSALDRVGARARTA